MQLMVAFSRQLTTSSLYKLAFHRVIFCSKLHHQNTDATARDVTVTCNHAHLGTRSLVVECSTIKCSLLFDWRPLPLPFSLSTFPMPTWRHSCDKCSQSSPVFCRFSTSVFYWNANQRAKNEEGLGTRLLKLLWLNFLQVKFNLLNYICQFRFVYLSASFQPIRAANHRLHTNGIYTLTKPARKLTALLPENSPLST